MSNIRYPTKEVIEKLSKELNISNKYYEDWEYINADKTRINEFIDYYCSNNLNDIEKFTLMILIISSCDDAVRTDSLEKKTWENIKRILITEKDIHLSTIEYWSCFEKSIEDAFYITPLVREVIEGIMNFRIQTSHPCSNLKYYPYEKEIHNIAEAIEYIFPMITEKAFIVWNNVYIPFSYKYDVSSMIENILHMLREIRNNNNAGELNIDWGDRYESL